MPECLHTRKFCKSIFAQGGLTYPNVGSRFTPKGWPDRTIICPWGLIVLLELKDEDGKLRREQLEQLAFLERLKAPAWVGRFMSDKPYPIRLERSDGDILTGWTRWGLFFDTVRSVLEIR